MKEKTCFVSKISLCACVPLLVLMLHPASVQSARKVATGDNEVAGGFGFQVGIPNYSPGGFKWFNDYSRGLSERVWLNLQFNVTLGNVHDEHCWYDERINRWRCTDSHWDGNALELAIGPKLRFPVSRIPLIIDAKLGGAFEILFFGGDYAGVGLAFRGGVGVHYYLFENLGVGAEIMFNFGAAFIQDLGAEFYGTFDFQVIGVQFRF